MAQKTSKSERSGEPLAIVLSGGGARAAYQAGFLRGVGQYAPELRFPIITGVSAGAINASFLASHPGPLGESGHALAQLWTDLTVDQVFRVDLACLGQNVARWMLRLVSGGALLAPKVRGLVETKPLDAFLRGALVTENGVVSGIHENLEKGHLRAFALSTLHYSTGQTITWVEGCQVRTWDRPNRRSHKTRITIDHIMASAALPLVFPAIEIEGTWYGDGGIRLAAPLSPALHLGACRILTISNRYQRSAEEAERPASLGYPPPAQVIGNLLNAVFLDVLDQDAERLERMNTLLRELSLEDRQGLRPVDLLLLRPSRDLGRLAGEYEPKLPKGFRFLTRSLGTRQTSSPDFLSLLMFQDDYLDRLIRIGEVDALDRKEDVLALIEDR